MVPGRAGIAFIDYDTVEQSSLAKESTAGMSLEGEVITINFAR